MTKKKLTEARERMIHIRLDEKTHRRLKIEAVKNDSSIQELVEGLIVRKLTKSKRQDGQIG